MPNQLQSSQYAPTADLECFQTLFPSGLRYHIRKQQGSQPSSLSPSILQFPSIFSLSVTYLYFVFLVFAPVLP